jgi:hypothetical protein
VPSGTYFLYIKLHLSWQYGKIITKKKTDIYILTNK